MASSFAAFDLSLWSLKHFTNAHAIRYAASSVSAASFAFCAAAPELIVPCDWQNFSKAATAPVASPIFVVKNRRGLLEPRRLVRVGGQRGEYSLEHS